MLNRYCQILLLGLASTMGLAHTALSVPLLPELRGQAGQSTTLPDFAEATGQGFAGANQPFCYMQTADGRFLNLEMLCDGSLLESSSAPVSGSPQRPNFGRGYAADAQDADAQDYDEEDYR